MNPDPSPVPNGGSAGEASRLRLQEFREVLMALHKTLLDSERKAYELVFGPVQSPNQLLNLVLNDPWFSWLRQLSLLTASIDASLDDKKTPLTDQKVLELIDSTRTLLRPADGGEASFSIQYMEALQRDPDVVMAHAEVARLFIRKS